jgi:hypothetical protein
MRGFKMRGNIQLFISFQITCSKSKEDGATTFRGKVLSDWINKKGIEEIRNRRESELNPIVE